MGRLAIVWEGETVGYMEEPMPDMYYLEGKWMPSDSPKTKEFLRATQGLDVRKNTPGGSEDYTRLSERRDEFEVVGTLAERGRAGFATRYVVKVQQVLPEGPPEVAGPSVLAGGLRSAK